MKITMNSIFTSQRALGAAILLLLIISSVQLRAAELPVFTIINAGLGKQFGLKINQGEGERALFTVSTPRGEVLLSQRISGADYSGLYSLERLHEGEYVFVLATQANEIRQPVRLTSRAILYQLSQRQVVHLPEVIQKGRQVDVNYLNPAQEDFTIELLNASGDVLYSEEFIGLADIEKRLNLLRIPAGRYLVSMSIARQKWNQEITVE